MEPYELAVYEESISTLGRPACKDIIFTSSLSTQALLLVLRLLPERTLVRLMCVCRSWHTMVAIGLHNVSNISKWRLHVDGLSDSAGIPSLLYLTA
jgi:hypothetical protein